MTSTGNFAAMMIRVIGFVGLAAAGLALLHGGGALAQEPKLLGEFDAWAAYTYKTDAGATVCYIVSQPTESAPKNVKRDPIFFLVTHRPGERVRNEVNTIVGYPFKKNSTATVTVGESKFDLFTSGDGAWADSADRDRAIVEAMKGGTTMRLKGTSWRGTETTDRYSLKGVSAAMDKIDAECK